MMADLVLPGGKILAECVEYDPTAYGGMIYIFIYHLFITELYLFIIRLFSNVNLHNCSFILIE